MGVFGFTDNTCIDLQTEIAITDVKMLNKLSYCTPFQSHSDLLALFEKVYSLPCVIKIHLETRGSTNYKNCLTFVDLKSPHFSKHVHYSSINLTKSLEHMNAAMSLVNRHGSIGKLNYEDHYLTYFCRDSIGGNAKTHFILSLDPSSRGISFSEISACLQFSDNLRRVKNFIVDLYTDFRLRIPLIIEFRCLRRNWRV